MRPRRFFARGPLGAAGSLCARAGVAAVLLLLASPAQGQFPYPSLLGKTVANHSRGETVSTTPHPAIARIIVPEKDGVSYGSGSLVDVRGDYGLVVTNHHVVRDRSGVVSVLFPNGFSSKADVVKEDKDWDLAALSIRNPSVAPLTMSAVPPQIGDRLTIAGYGSGDFRAAVGKCLAYGAPNTTLPPELVEVGAEARNGDSGGPILNERGEIAGVLFGTNKTTHGAYGGRVLQFLTSVLPGGVPATPPATSSPNLTAIGPPAESALASGVPRTVSPNDPFAIAEPEVSRQLSAMAQNSPSSRALRPNVIPGRSSENGPLIPIPNRRVAELETEGTSKTGSEIVPMEPDRDLLASAPQRDGPLETSGAPKSAFSFTAPVAPLTARKGKPPETTSSLQDAPADQLLAAAWKQIGGTSTWDQVKTILAFVGLIALFVVFWRMNGRPDAPVEEE